MTGSSASAPTISEPLVLSGPAGTIAVVPARGAKITSLTDVDGTEWLAPCRTVMGDPAVFVDAEMGGWDECAPTLTATVLPDGRRLGDHGDVWSEPWQVDPVGEPVEALVCTVLVDRLGFLLQRTMVATDTGFRFSYRAELLAEAAPLPFLWVAHPQFLAPDRIELPGLPSVRQVHPEPTSEPERWDAAAFVRATGARKLWVWPDEVPSSVTLVRGGSRLTMSWGGDPLRGLALWVDPAEFGPSSVVAVEPATGPGDDAGAPQTGAPLLTAARPLEWWLAVDLIHA